MIVVAGATGDLGGRIVRELCQLQAPVRALVRKGASTGKLRELAQPGCKILEVDFNDSEMLSKACLGGTVVVSALAGLRETMVVTGTAPFILFKINRVLCWGDPQQLTDWTTIEDTARFTALAAMDQ